MSSYLTERIIADWYDGIYWKETESGDYFADGGHDSFVIFDPDKVKVIHEYSHLSDSLDSPN